jgi:hypothetical protein
MNEEDLKALEAAVQLLETPGLAARLTDMVGKPIELIGKAMPASVSQEITAAALRQSVGEQNRGCFQGRGLANRPIPRSFSSALPALMAVRISEDC